MNAAIDGGFKKAFSAIFDGNITTLITAAVLYYFGASRIQGFAITLAIGIIVSMFTAIVVTRILLNLITNANPNLGPSFFGAGGKRS